MTADPAGQELNIGERVDYTRSHLPAEQREPYEQALREATEGALATGDYGPLGEVAELYQILAVTPPAWTIRPRRPAAPLAAQRGRADG